MGKKSKLKAIRKIAANLPTIHVKAPGVPEVLTGAELAAKGITNLPNGDSVLSHMKYKKGTVVERPVNHERQMKKLYAKHGVAGVRSYVNAAQAYVDRMQKKETEEVEVVAFDKSVGEGEE